MNTRFCSNRAVCWADPQVGVFVNNFRHGVCLRQTTVAVRTKNNLKRSDLSFEVRSMIATKQDL